MSVTKLGIERCELPRKRCTVRIELDVAVLYEDRDIPILNAVYPQGRRASFLVSFYPGGPDVLEPPFMRLLETAEGQTAYVQLGPDRCPECPDIEWGVCISEKLTVGNTYLPFVALDKLARRALRALHTAPTSA